MFFNLIAIMIILHFEVNGNRIMRLKENLGITDAKQYVNRQYKKGILFLGCNEDGSFDILNKQPEQQEYKYVYQTDKRGKWHLIL